MDKKLTILIIDDNAINVRALGAILKNEGFFTVKADSGPDGRLLAQAVCPDLILLDILMPGESGFDTCNMLKQNPATADIPIIFLSAVHDVESKVKGLSIGAVDYITKPFERAEVLARTRLHIRLKRAYHALIEEQKSQLRLLHDAQQAILVRPDDFPDAGFAVYYKAMQEAGGDFYDVLRIGDGIFGYFVADISGHDIRASFITAALKALIKQNSGPLFSAQETLKMINSVMRSILADGQHLTACYVHLNRHRSKLTVVSAGHPPIIYIDSDGRAEQIRPSGDILGAFNTVIFQHEERAVKKGERFFLYTDGLIEGFGENKLRREEGIKNLIDYCLKTRDSSLNNAVVEVMGELFLDGSPPRDDLLLLGVEV